MSWADVTSQSLAEKRKQFSELVRNHRELCDKSVRVFAHPEATDAQILEVAKILGRNRRELAKVRDSLAEIHYRKGLMMHGNFVAGTKL